MERPKIDIEGYEIIEFKIEGPVPPAVGTLCEFHIKAVRLQEKEEKK